MHSVFQLIPKAFSEVELRALCKPLEYFQTNLDKPCLHGFFVQLALCKVTLSCWNTSGASASNFVARSSYGGRGQVTTYFQPYSVHEFHGYSTKLKAAKIRYMHF